MMTLLIALVTAAFLGVASPALADAPRITAKTLLGFCSGDESYGPYVLHGCSHYANGVIDALQPEICAPLDQSAMLRDALATWLRDQELKQVNLSAMSGADAIRSMLAAYCPAGENR